MFPLRKRTHSQSGNLLFLQQFEKYTSYAEQGNLSVDLKCSVVRKNIGLSINFVHSFLKLWTKLFGSDEEYMNGIASSHCYSFKTLSMSSSLKE